MCSSRRASTALAPTNLHVFLQNLPFDLIVERLRPLGPQWVANVLGAALLPEPVAPMKRKRLEPRHEMWAQICKCNFHKIAWEDDCYGVIAEGNGRKAPPKITAVFTSVARRALP